MLIRLAILIMTIAWLVASLPQSRFIWTSTVHTQGSFDYWMGMLRAVIIDFLPLAIVFIQSELEKAHLSKAQRSFTRRKLEDKGHDFDTWARTYPTPEGQIEKRMPLLFGLITAVVAISYEAYYVEFGQTLQVYETTWDLLGYQIAVGGLVKALVHIVYLSVAALVTYVFGRLSSAMKVHLVFEDLAKMLKPRPKRKVTVEEKPKQISRGFPKLPPKIRQEEILKLLNQNKDLTVEELAQKFMVSDQTIRNDFRALTKLGKILYKGGKILPPEVDYGDL